MKLRNILMAVILAVCTSSAANASVDFGDSLLGGPASVDMGPLAISGPQDGTFYIERNTVFDGGTIQGILANNSIIEFTYHLANAILPNSVQSDVGTSIGIYSEANSSAGTIAAVGGVFATANIVSLTGKTSISNFSGAAQSFTTTFSGLLEQFITGSGTVGRITYTVSAVPIPTSVLMFGAAIIGMFAFARKQRKEAIAFA
ncbi:MAG: hypothetical protein ABL857_08430 [Rickettsiales bacterium]|jgi:hypothetical protein